MHSAEYSSMLVFLFLLKFLDILLGKLKNSQGLILILFVSDSLNPAECLAQGRRSA